MALRKDEYVPHDGHTERIERVEHFHGSGDVTPTPATNVSAGSAAVANDAVTAITRVVMVVFAVLEVLLLLRFVFKLGGANASQPLVAELYALTDGLVRPFQGIFPEPQVGTVVDVAAILSILFLSLVSWLIVALVRAIAGRQV